MQDHPIAKRGELFAYQRRPCSYPIAQKKMGNLELCSALDKHEFMHSHLHACQFTDRRRHELVAGNTYHFFGKYDCTDTDDPEWSCRRKIWNTLSCICKSQLWNKGANIPAMLRAIVACGWFGIQTWIGGASIYNIIKAWQPSLPEIDNSSLFPQVLPMICFLLFWLLNMFIVYLGVESIRKLLIFKAIFLPIAALALLFWAISAANGLGPILEQPSKLQGPSFWNYFFPALTGMVGFWATLSLNIPDFTRYAKSQKAQIKGQAIGLPPSMTLFSFIGVVVTSATAIVYGSTIWDPVQLAGRFENKLVVTFAMISVAISTLATNIAANIVSPANDFSNLWPSKINFRTGGYITGIIGVFIFPWKLVADPTGYIYNWLVGYSALLGPVGGIMIADYYFIRKQTLNTGELYNASGQYSFRNGFNRYAIIALLLGILPNVPGFLLQVKLVSSTVFPQWISHLYNYAWFVGFLVSGITYIIMMRSYKTIVNPNKATYVAVD
jgi:NCS1 family nucleobase:cation symporter-1